MNKRKFKREENKNRTIKDVEQFPFQERYKYDPRKIFSFFWYLMRNNHQLASIFFHASVLTPYIRIISTFAVMSVSHDFDECYLIKIQTSKIALKWIRMLIQRTGDDALQYSCRLYNQNSSKI